MKRSYLALTGIALSLLLLPAHGTDALQSIDNIVVIYAENRSFDNLYGLFPGARGIADALADPQRYRQLDRDGATPLPRLPPAFGAGPAWDWIAALPNEPFLIPAAAGYKSPDLVHRFYNNQMQIHAGRNDQFAAWSDVGGLSMGYYDGSAMAMWKLARSYTLADNFFQGAFGGSFLNHFWLVCACTPPFPDPPTARISSVDASGVRLNLAAASPASAVDGRPVYVADTNISPRLADGRHYAINTTQPAFQPSGIAPALGGDPLLADPAGDARSGPPLPPLTVKSVGDTLTAKRVDWKWYAGGWKQALADRAAIYGGAPPNLQAHHQPFNYFARFDPTTAAGAAQRAAHLKDYADLIADARAGRLPPVAFYKPSGKLNQHPGYADLMEGDAHLAEVVATLQASPQWGHMLIIVAYDENGGLWDHVSPPAGDVWGPGSRIPAILISPYARKGYVDHTLYDTTSIIKLITRRFDLEPLAGVRERVGDLSGALQPRPD